MPETLKGERVDYILATLMPAYSRVKLTNWLKDGVITIDGQHLKPKIKLRGGEIITFHQSPETLAPTAIFDQAESIALHVVYEDEHLLVVNKPAGLVVHPGAGNLSGTLVNALLHHDPQLSELPRAGIIHRLDKDTTGLLLIAKTLSAHTVLTRAMQVRAIDRHYLALVHGHLVSGGTISTHYGRHPRHRLKMAVCATGKEAITTYTIHKHYPLAHATLLKLKLMTGRTHQIRVHLAHIHHPIVGDALYGTRPKYPKLLDEHARTLFLNFNRQALHAETLSFKHPFDDKHLTLTARLPDDFQQLIDALNQDAHGTTILPQC